MIQYDTDRVTLYYVVNGQRISRSPLDGDAYYQLVVIEEAQTAAIGENNAAAVDYHTKLNNFQGEINAGRAAGLTSAAMPLMKTVADDGTVTMGPFVPALPVAVYPTVSPSQGSGKSAPAPDRIDVLINLVMVLNGKLDRLLAGGK